MHEGEERGAAERGESFVGFDGSELEGVETVRLGHDIRFVLAAVGGGGIRVGRAIARRHLPYLETVAINCDSRVQEFEEFDRRISLGSEHGESGGPRGSAQAAGELARSAGPVLARVFEGATFVTIVASLGGASGTGALPYVVEAAARSSSALQVFVIKPFEAEGERRALADRALARLHFLEAFVEKRERGHASLEILDNESIARAEPRLPIGHLDRYWGEQVSRRIEHELIHPAEAVLKAERAAALARPSIGLRPVSSDPELSDREPLIPVGPRLAPLAADPGAVELTFEVLPPSPGAPGPS